jgi:very-short-patch-repair endonuclease/endogenous inhibitor of DNA gyrase (YacG/DUF329 family)
MYFNSNSNGIFTNHLKNHDLKLIDYLKQYVYSKDDLICNNCNKEYTIYRNIPQKEKHKCKKITKLICNLCNKEFISKDNRYYKFCSKECQSSHMSSITTEYHKDLSNEEKEVRYKKIINARLINGNTGKGNKAWNSGKIGVYTPETIEKIRNAALNQLENGKIRKTKIEKKMDIILEVFKEKFKINYKYSKIIAKRQFDFILPDYNILIECDGDFWHANPKFYPNPSEFQIKRISDDKVKNKIAEENGYLILRFWEDEINNNTAYVINTIRQSILLQRNLKR